MKLVGFVSQPIKPCVFQKLYPLLVSPCISLRLRHYCYEEIMNLSFGSNFFPDFQFLSNSWQNLAKTTKIYSETVPLIRPSLVSPMHLVRGTGTVCSSHTLIYEIHST